MSNPEYLFIKAVQKGGDGVINCSCEAAKKGKCRLASFKDTDTMKKCYDIVGLGQGNLTHGTILHCDAAAFFYAGMEGAGADDVHYFAVLMTKQP